MNPEIQTPPSRFPFFRRCLRAVFSRKMLYAVIIFITLIALGYAVENFRGARAWESYRKDAEARGVKLDFAAHIPPPIPDAENGANTPWIQSWFIRPKSDDTNRWAELRRQSTNQWPQIFFLAEQKNNTARSRRTNERRLTDFVAWQQAFANARAKTKPQRTVQTERDTQQQTQAALAILEELKIYQPVLDELRAASTKPRIRYPVDYKLDEPFSILLPHLSRIKGTVLELGLQSCAELAADRTEDAFKDVQLMLWLTESVRDESFLINQLVRIACLQITTQTIWEGLAQHKWTDAQLQTLEERLGQIDFFSNIERSMNMECASGITTIEWVRTKGSISVFLNAGEDNGVPGPISGFLIGRLAPRGWFRMESANYGRMMENNLKGAIDPIKRTINLKILESNNRDRGNKLKGGFANFFQHRIFARLILPALETAWRKFILAQNTAEEAALACALERHRLATGQLPETLDALVPKFIARLPHDPFNGAPLKYERIGETDFVLSSVGWDQRDEEGAAVKVLAKRTDWVWRSAP